MDETLYKIAESWTVTESPVNSTEQLLKWVSNRNEMVSMEIRKCQLSEDDFWNYDENSGTIHNRNHSFFSVCGFRRRMPDGTMICQPIILQPEIGLLGILCKEFHGIMHFLMQAKIEPGNINKIQLSPTIQATKSNFTQQHGGSKPPYLEYFENASKYEIVVDQIQSEQASRFFKKRNRNVLIHVKENVEVLSSHRWMTLGQIKRLMREENLVNMDTRTILSCIPFKNLKMDEESRTRLRNQFEDKAFFDSVFGENIENTVDLWNYINNYKMFTEGEPELIPLSALSEWSMTDTGIICKKPYPFKVVYCDITVDGREVGHWIQPLFEACGIACMGLICCKDQGRLKFLVKVTPEVGCFDFAELGPTYQREAIPIHGDNQEDVISRFFLERLEKKEGIFFDQLLSEEGGRFYHEQNRNILMKVSKEQLPALPEDYFLLDYRTLNNLVQVNNILNIQLRNLLALLEA